MGTPDLARTYDYPFWGPNDNGPARDISLVSQAIGSPQVNAILEDSLRLKNPQYSEEDNRYLNFWQQAPVIMAAPQAPVMVPDQYARADSLMAYATMTLSGQATQIANSQLGNAGQKSSGSE